MHFIYDYKSTPKNLDYRPVCPFGWKMPKFWADKLTDLTVLKLFVFKFMNSGNLPLIRGRHQKYGFGFLFVSRKKRNETFEETVKIFFTDPCLKPEVTGSNNIIVTSHGWILIKWKNKYRPLLHLRNWSRMKNFTRVISSGSSADDNGPSLVSGRLYDANSGK